MISITNTLAPTAVESPELNNANLKTKQLDFLQKVIEGLQDGILILTEIGEIVHANASARSICGQISQGISQANFVPPAIWHHCKSLIDWSLFPNQHVILSDEIVLNKFNIFRLRVRWLDVDPLQRPCLLVTIENKCETLKNVAIAEVKKYDLTRREAEIWLLYRCNYSYKEIAGQLYISLNTVKKHMKNIHAKRQANIHTQN
ncbi:MAG: helix-turn-helix transcriptional regulator [Tolypothrix carrinoi HA7290-LM1]|jgi:DNA-binding CsgD family transcriptional regulator|nr:helix-turn-helix transcriptional regulator [Tolypothrix carrinoi HA7290-LM1]